MKTRNGLVSNSSSSSFVCSICGGIESGMDISLSDLDMIQCVNGHTLHNDCKSKYINDDSVDIAVETGDEDDDEDGDGEISPKHCPICTLQALTDDNELDFLRWVHCSTKEDSLKTIKERFVTYKNFQEVVNLNKNIKE